jgi:hypothetical protein
VAGERTLDTDGIIEIVETVADGGVDPLTRCSRYDPRICKGSLGTSQGYGALCTAHVAGLKKAPERIAEIRRWLTDHEDDTCHAEVSDDCVAAYKREYPRATEDEARCLAAWGVRLQKRDELVQLAAAIAPQDEGVITPGRPPLVDRHRDLEAKFNRLRVDIELRSARRLRIAGERARQKMEAAAPSKERWETLDFVGRHPLVAEIHRSALESPWRWHLEQRSGLAEKAFHGDFEAFWDLLYLSRGFDPDLDPDQRIGQEAEHAGGLRSPATLPPDKPNIGDEATALGEGVITPSEDDSVRQGEDDPAPANKRATERLRYRLGLANHALRQYWKEKDPSKRTVTVKELVAQMGIKHATDLSTRARKFNIDLTVYKQLNGDPVFDPKYIIVNG